MSNRLLIRRLTAGLFGALQAKGYPLGPGKLMQVEELLQQLPQDTEPEALRTLLAPLLTSNAEEQRSFYELFDQTLAALPPLDEPQNLESELNPTSFGPDTETSRRRYLLAALLALVGLAGFIVDAKTPFTWLPLAAALTAAAVAGWKLPPRRRARLRYLLALPLVAAAGFAIKLWLLPADPDDIPKPPPRVERFAVEQGQTVSRPLPPPADTARLLSCTALDGQRSGATASGGSYAIDTTGTLSYTAPADAAPGTVDSIGVEALYAGRKDTVYYVADLIAGQKPEPETKPGTELIAEMELPFPRSLSEIEVDPAAQARADFYRRFQWPLKALLFLLTGFALWAFMSWNERRRAKFVAEIEQRDSPPYVWRIETGEEQRIEFEESLALLLNRLRRREGAETRRIDVRATVKASARKAGRAELVYREQTRPPEYLLLIDRFDANDHRARLFDALYQELLRVEVPAERFFYQGDPRVCFNEAHPDGLPLSELLHRHRDARLLLIGEGQRLIVPSTGQLAPWANLFSGWRRRALLLPKPTREWGRREQTLAGLFALAPATVQGLDLTLEQFETLEQRSPADILRRVGDAVAEPFQFEGSLLSSLRRHFAEPLIQWIAACAVYPVLHWDLTLYLGRALSDPDGPSLLSAAHLRQLARLPWFVQGRIPENGRLQLIEYLAEQGLETRVRRALDELLRSAPAPAQGSVAWDDYRMNVILNELMLQPDAARRRALEAEFERFLAAGKQPDFVSFKQLQRQPSRLDVVVPDNWKKYLFRHGSARFGLRYYARLLPLLLLAALGIALAPVKTRVCSGETVRYQERLLCLNDADARLLYLEYLTRDAIDARDHNRADSLRAEASNVARSTAPPADTLPYYRNTAAWYYNTGARYYNCSKIPGGSDCLALPADSLLTLACEHFRRADALHTAATGEQGIEFFSAMRRACPQDAASDTARFTLRGQVLDAATGRPIPQATLRAADAATATFERLRANTGNMYRAATDAQGRYTIEGVPAATAQLHLYAEAPGYEADTLRSRPQAELPAIRLQPSKAAVEAADWQRAAAADTPEAYSAYLAKHPDGPNAAEARRRQAEGLSTRERNDWEEAQRANTVAAYERYKSRYPNGAFVPQADAAIRVLQAKAAADAAIAANTIAAYDAFLSGPHRDSEHAPDIRRRRDALQEAADYRDAIAANTTAAYDAYLAKWPNAANAADAARRRDAIKPVTTTNSAIIQKLEADMVRVAGGSFTMGCLKGRNEPCDSDGWQEPTRTVRVQAFSIGRYEVTQAQWRAVMGSDPPELYNKGCDECPVEQVSWNDIQEFLRKLNAQTGKQYRLPTEAEWEYAARGGSQRRDFLYSGSKNLDVVGWYNGNYKAGNTFGAQKTTRPVGGKKPNELGLYDMSGNVWEWVEDCWHANYKGAPTDGRAWLEANGGDCSRRVLRGGSWFDASVLCRAASRDWFNPSDRNDFIGFRLARD